MKKAASWLMAETIFGLAAYSAAAHPCLFDPTGIDPTWSSYEPGSVDRRD
jgi:hypothetical protein